ncbi:anti-sigma factor [Gracilibacillus dipsosauri]|uniref:Uncharacterized protein n=1 Tax=Gracilibacillus dipsosauri TaxID=178340 RepID=A0A317KW20_9BACI|nr:anti-sigma factor [Gracilibacillus dipsosauri]PWU66890.1 hypothetical protein DLJ74_18690 [Gracilibacillus dipsosauri]
MSSNHLKEEKIIDLLDGNVSEEEKFEIQNHINTCPKCQGVYKFWQNTMESMTDVSPSPSLKERLDESIEKKKSHRFISFKPIILTASLAIVAFLFWGLNDIVYQSNTVQPEYEIYQNNEINEESLFTNSPHVEVQQLVSFSNTSNIDGALWVNKETQEMLLKVKGLEGLEQNDYQLWIVDQDNHAEGELLMVDTNGEAKVLYRLNDLSEYKHIKASVEPLGGSKTPTGPETFFVDFD